MVCRWKACLHRQNASARRIGEITDIGPKPESGAKPHRRECQAFGALIVHADPADKIRSPLDAGKPSEDLPRIREAVAEGETFGGVHAGVEPDRWPLPEHLGGLSPFVEIEPS